MQDRSNPIANALELLQFCAKSSICTCIIYTLIPDTHLLSIVWCVIMIWLTPSLKPSHSARFFVNGGTGGCRYDNLWCTQWRKVGIITALGIFAFSIHTKCYRTFTLYYRDARFARRGHFSTGDEYTFSSMAQCKTAVTPVRQQRSYCSFALSHRRDDVVETQST